MNKRRWIVVLQVTECARPGLDKLSNAKDMKAGIKAKFYGEFLKAKVVGLRKLKP